MLVSQPASNVHVPRVHPHLFCSGSWFLPTDRPSPTSYSWPVVRQGFCHSRWLGLMWPVLPGHRGVDDSQEGVHRLPRLLAAGMPGLHGARAD